MWKYVRCFITTVIEYIFNHRITIVFIINRRFIGVPRPSTSLQNQYTGDHYNLVGVFTEHSHGLSTPLPPSTYRLLCSARNTYGWINSAYSFPKIPRGQVTHTKLEKSHLMPSRCARGRKDQSASKVTSFELERQSTSSPAHTLIGRFS